MLRQLKGALDDFRAALRPGGPVVAVPPDKQPATETAEPARPTPLAPAAAESPDDNATRIESPERPVPAAPDAVPPAVPVTRGRRRGPAAAIAMTATLLLAVGGLGWAPALARRFEREPADPEVVATYQGGTVTREQLKRQFEAIPQEEQIFYRTADGLKALVDDAVVHEVTRRWAEEKQVDQQDVFKEAMKHATENIQIADVSDQLHQGRIAVGEAEIQAYYDKNRELFGERPLAEVKEQARQAVVEAKEQEFITNYLKDLKERASLQVDYSLLDVPEPSEQELLHYYQTNRQKFAVPERVKIAEIQISMSLAGSHERAKQVAEAARARAVAGEDFGKLAEELSDGPGKTQGGIVPEPLARGTRGPEFDAAVFPLNVGELSAVFMDGDSHYLIKLLERTPGRQRSFEEARTEIAATVRAEREQQVYDERKERTLFTIHSRRTTFGEFLQELNELPPESRGDAIGPAGKRKVLDALIERLLVVEDASEQATDVKRKDDIDRTRSDLLARLLHQEEVDEKSKVSDEEVRAEYDTNRERYVEPARIKVRYIRVSRGVSADEDTQARAKIDEAAAKIKPEAIFGGTPTDFAEVAKQYSEDPDTAAKGGELDTWLSETGNPEAEVFEHALHEQLLPLKVGDISAVVPLGDSYFLFQIREKQEARQRSFEEAQELVRRELEARKHEELSRTMGQDLLARMQLKIYDRRIEQVLAEMGGPAPELDQPPAEFDAPLAAPTTDSQ